MKWYNKNTRNEANEFYRRQDWSVERPADWNHPDFTTVTPPDETLNDGVVCDWDEDTQSWILDADEVAEDTRRKSAIQDFLDSPFNDVTKAQVNTYIDNNVIDLPSAKSTMKLMLHFTIGLREVIREFARK